MAMEKVRLGDLLVKAGAISESQLQRALEEQRLTHSRLGEVLIKNGWVTERHLAGALAQQLKKPLVSLARFKPMPEALRLVPEQIARRLEVFPMSVSGSDLLTVAISDPLNVFALDELRMLTGMEVEINLATPTEIRRALDTAYIVQETFTDAGIEVMASQGIVETELTTRMDGVGAEEAPVVKLVNNMLEQAVREGASDLHLEPHERSSRVRFRVDGALFDALEYPRGLHPAVVSRVKIMANMDIAEKRRPQDGRIIIKVLEHRIDLRVSSLPTVYGEKIVIRVLDQSNTMVGLDRIGFECDDKELTEELLNVPHGILLVTGPTGSGKSTTLYSMLERLNKPEVNIVTIEDPVEYTISGINQVHVNEKTGLSFAECLRAILRQDPDKIMVGEIRDLVTAQMAIRAALTGHMVLSTLHTNDAPSSIVRLVDMGIAPFLVASSLIAAIAQRLVRKLCPECKERYALSESLAASLGLVADVPVWRAVGCPSCRGTGYRGRTAIFEIMVMDDTMKRSVVSGESAVALRKKALEGGMRTLREQGLRKALQGETSLEEVLQVSMA
jgi:type IV pilus assembly protein PilB